MNLKIIVSLSRYEKETVRQCFLIFIPSVALNDHLKRMEIWFNHCRRRMSLSHYEKETVHECFLIFIASVELNDHLKRMQIWFNNWRIRINQLKSKYGTFTLRKGDRQPVFFIIHSVSGTKWPFKMHGDWFNHWRIRINELKSNRVTFTLRKGDCPTVFLNIKILHESKAIYLGLGSVLRVDSSNPFRKVIYILLYK